MSYRGMTYKGICYWHGMSNQESEVGDMAPRCITIGASAGGFEVLKEIVSQLPADFPVPVFVVLHLLPYERSVLADILDQAGSLHAIHPEDGQNVEPGFIYVAPPDHHLLTDDGHIAVKRDPRKTAFVRRLTCCSVLRRTLSVQE